MLKPIEKINCVKTEQLFIDSTETFWISTSIRGVHIWKHYSMQEQFQIPLFIRGQLKLIENNTKISGGYFEYDIESKKYSGSDAIANILDGINHSLNQNGLLYEVENSMFNSEGNRLVLALHHRVSRRGDPNLDIEIPSNVFGLVNLETKELISILDQSISSYQNFILTDQHIVGLSVQDYVDSLTVWEMGSGKKLFTLPFKQMDISAISPIPNQESFMIILRNGDVIQYNIEERKQVILKEGGVLTQKAFALSSDSLYIFFDKNAKGTLYKIQDETLKVIDEIELNGIVVDFYFNKETMHLWIVTDSKTHSISVYKLTN